ncbi:MAG: ATP-binding protein [Chloroflexota bacterium]
MNTSTYGNRSAIGASPDQVIISLPSTRGYEKVARSAAASVAEEMGFTQERIEDVKTAIAEVCSNAIEHGNREDRRAHVAVLLTAAKEQLEINVADEGLTPMPDVLPMPGQPDSGEAGSRGWGMFFISQLVDEVEITRLPEGGNMVKLVIYLKPTRKSKGKNG